MVDHRFFLEQKLHFAVKFLIRKMKSHDIV